MSDPSPPLIDFSSISHFLKNKLKGPKTVFLDKNTPVLLAKKRLVAGEIPPLPPIDGKCLRFFRFILTTSLRSYVLNVWYVILGFTII